MTEYYPPDVGGSAVLLDNVYRRLTTGPLTVIAGSHDAASSELTSAAGRVIRLPLASASWGLTRFDSLRRYLRLAARIRVESRPLPSVVHCGRALPEGFAALMATRLQAGLRYILWTHGEELAYAASSRELTLLLRRVHRGAAAVIANCHNTASRLAALGVPDEKVHVVYPGVDAARFAEPAVGRPIRERYLQSGGLLLVTVGRLQRRKGHDLVVQAVGALRRELPDLRYVIAGDGDERAALTQLVRRLELEDRVHFAGKVSDAELPAYYAAADVFVHPNRVDRGDVEGFGIVFLEAAAAGVPVIGGANGGVPEAVEAGRTGLLVSGNDVAELVAAIRTLARSERLRRRMGEAGRARVLRQFTWDRAAADVAAIHRSVAEGG